jgi:hypothetical protein
VEVISDRVSFVHRNFIQGLVFSFNDEKFKLFIESKFSNVKYDTGKTPTMNQGLP